MKKIALAIAFAAATTFATAQDGNNICVFNSLTTYDGGKGDPQDLVRAMKCSDEAIVDASTSVKSKTWFYRGKLLTLISMDKTLKPQYPNVMFDAIAAFQKLHDLNDPKFKDWNEVGDYLTPTTNNLAVAASEKFQAKEYAQAYKLFYGIKDANTLLAAHKLKINIPTATALYNAALAADRNGNAGDALKATEELYIIQPDTLATIKQMIELSKKTGQADKANTLLDQALKKYPKDAYLLTQKVNAFIGKGDYQGALVFINSLLESDPLNDGALNAKGQAYQESWKTKMKQIDSLGTTAADIKKAAELNAQANIFGDSLVAAYKQAISINAKSINAWTNLGAYYVDIANTYVAKMNALGGSAEDIKKANALKQEQKQYFLKAKENLIKAKELTPDDAQLARTLQKIEMLTAE